MHEEVYRVYVSIFVRVRHDDVSEGEFVRGFEKLHHANKKDINEFN